MSKIIQAIEAEQMNDIEIPDFAPGDTITVKIKVKEGNRERIQAFEGVVIAKRNRASNSSFTVRKMSHGHGVERVFQTYSRQIESITIKRRGLVRKAKLYYLRKLSGKKARIKEKLSIKSSATAKNNSKKAAPQEKQNAPEAAAAKKESATKESPAKQDKNDSATKED